MSSKIELEKLGIDDVDIFHLRDFTHGKGWSHKSIQERIYFTSPPDHSGEKLRFIVPADRSFSDFKLRVNELISGVAYCQRTEVKSVWSELYQSIISPTLSHQGSLRIRVHTRTESNNSLDFKGIEGIVKHSKMMLSHALSMDLDGPEPWRKKPAPKASEAIDEFEVGQTEIGSYIVTLRTPSHLSRQTSWIPAAPSHEMKSLIRLARGLAWIRKNPLAEEGTNFKELIEFGINSNVASHVASIRDELGGIDVDFIFGLGDAAPEIQTIGDPVFTVGGSFSAKLKRVAYLLRGASTQRATLSGRITNLFSRDPIQDSLIKRITFETSPNQPAGKILSSRRFSLELSKEVYLQALQAHSLGRIVRISGNFLVRPDFIQVLDLEAIDFS